ncbi:diguanylate cyclase domain-containing protein [Rhodoferax sp.]|uniref:diguanylate cyclase domain-containing protein n=1 Tax=Rhodoferax sp. TaxID=50421 RepID=UPI002774B86A|nr:diguanylate cyclase [Rhodoferax sp.]
MPDTDPQADAGWFKRLFETSPDPTWIIDGNRFVECNAAAIRTLGYANRDELLNVHPSQLSPPTQPDGEESFTKAERMLALVRQHGLHRFEWVHRKADGTEFLAEVTLSIITLQAQQLIHCVWRDITERKRIEDQLLRQNNLLSAVIENFPGAISVVDADLRAVAYNQQFKHLLDLPDSLLEQPGVGFGDIVLFNALRGDYGPGDPEQQAAALVERARNFEPHKFERVRPNGTVLEIRGMPMPGGGFVTTYIDITARKQAEEEIQNLAFHDALTKLPNRRLLNDRLHQAMAASKRSGTFCALMFLDLDNFKPLNDQHGHDVGDLLLIEVAHRLQSCVREVDTVSRFGGDEFVVLLSDLPTDEPTSTTQAQRIAEKIRSSLSQPYRLTCKRDGQSDTVIEHHCTVSIGVTVFVNQQTSQDDILRWADMAMYDAKEAGRNTVRFHDSHGSVAPPSARAPPG